MLETERLLIRNFKIEDEEACFLCWGQDIKLGKYIIGYPMQNISQMKVLVASFAQNENAWVVIEKQNQNIIGTITVDIPYIQLGIGEIGYIIGEKYQHKGYATEAVNCIVQEYIVNRKIYMIEAKYNEHNIASGCLLSKLGFHRDGVLRNRRIDIESGKRNDLVICSITLDDIR